MKSKKRLWFMMLVVVLVMSMASTALAVRQHYTGRCISSFRTTAEVDLINYVRDENSRCYFCPTATEYNTGYNSTAWKVGASSNFSSYPMRSGEDHTHGYRGDSSKGYLRFYNTDQPGQYIYINGYIS